MRVVIAGSGRLGSGLATVLSKDGNDVAVVDRPMDRRRLGASFDGLTIEGTPIDQEVLERAGLRKAELFVAATSDDNVNAAAVQAAKGFFHVPRAIARFMDPERAVFYKKLGVDAVCPTTTGLNQILDFIRTGDFSSLETIVDPDIICVRPRLEWMGMSPINLAMPSDRRVIGLVRGETVYGRDEGQTIRQSDSLLIARRGR